MIEGNTIRRVTAALEAEAAARRPGERLPSVRELMAAHGVGPGTVQRAVAALAARGVLEARPGQGTFVAEAAPVPAPAAAAPDLAWQSVALGPRPEGSEALEDFIRPFDPVAPEVLVLSTGYLPADLQPLGALTQALGRAARRPGAWDRVPPAGIAPLRAWFAAQAGGGVETGDVTICSGGQAALTACFRGLAAPGAPVLFESPTYIGALVAARAAGLDPVPVPTDAGGLRPDLLADALERTRARLVYAQPTFANPTGTTLAAGRRAEILEAVRAAGAFLIEDDPFRALAIDGEPPPPLAAADQHGHVVGIHSLTKASSPGLRIAGLSARGPAGVRLRQSRVIDDLFVAGPLQEAAIELVGAPAWRRHLRRLGAALRERRDALAGAVDEHLGPGRHVLPRGGVHLWVALDPHEDDAALVARAARAGVVVSSGRRYFPAEAPGPHLRLTYGGAPPARLAEGVRLLASVRG